MIEGDEQKKRRVTIVFNGKRRREARKVPEARKPTSIIARSLTVLIMLSKRSNFWFIKNSSLCNISLYLEH